MTKPNHGGPAFPVKDFYMAENIGPGKSMIAHPGMTLRQWYAGQALVGIEQTNECRGIDEQTQEYAHILAKSAFLIADAMIAHEAKENIAP